MKLDPQPSPFSRRTFRWPSSAPRTERAPRRRCWPPPCRRPAGRVQLGWVNMREGVAMALSQTRRAAHAVSRSTRWCSVRSPARRGPAGRADERVAGVHPGLARAHPRPLGGHARRPRAELHRGGQRRRPRHRRDGSAAARGRSRGVGRRWHGVASRLGALSPVRRARRVARRARAGLGLHLVRPGPARPRLVRRRRGAARAAAPAGGPSRDAARRGWCRTRPSPWRPR